VKRSRAAIVVVFLVFAALFFSRDLACAYSESEDGFAENAGPLTVRNQMPLYLFYLQMVPDKANVTERDRFTINADYTVSNITVSAFTPASSLYLVEIDLEVERVTLDLRYGLYDNLEIGLEIPYIALCQGYLDDPIESIEDGINARTPRSRERQGSNEFDYSLRYNGKYLIQKKTSMHGIGDIALTAKYQLLRETKWLWPNISLRMAVKFPTGDKDDLLGSGEFDYGAGLLIDKGFFDRFFVYLGGNVVRIEKPGFLSDLGVKEHIYSGLLAAEYFFTKRFSVVTQVTGNTTPYPQSDTNVLDNDGYELGVGFNYTLKEKKDVSWHFGISENISSASTPDVSLQTGLDWRF